MNKLLFRALAVAALSYTPLYRRLVYNRSVVPNQEEYCLQIWLSHARQYQQVSNVPLQHVAELGPGSTLGVGIWALLMGCERYTAIDSVQLTDRERNIAFFEASVNKLLSGELDTCLSRYGMDPAQTVREAERRLDDVRKELESLFAGKGRRMCYIAPGIMMDEQACTGADFVFSHAVLEHVDNIQDVSDSAYAMLRNGGVVSHCIDLSCHMTHDLWNGHWTYSQTVWKILRGGRSYLINRHSATDHLEALANSGFSLDMINRTRSDNTLSRSELAKEFGQLSDEDLVTSGLTVVGTKQK